MTVDTIVVIVLAIVLAALIWGAVKARKPDDEPGDEGNNTTGPISKDPSTPKRPR